MIEHVESLKRQFLDHAMLRLLDDLMLPHQKYFLRAIIDKDGNVGYEGIPEMKGAALSSDPKL